ncbi:hypothetical protein [Variovorax sp. J22R115]|uniref:hypothetical protein n=1 Tax=Variovorax sp. J22R115 TaxID=3053509 RepID=UPI00257667F2|nr:hypothetical protein [Variovorax sp. J22R115]MDM0049836.1 hypothetical protein [Variovorax sp. J22R115]
MTKIFASALLSILAAMTVLYAMQPVDAAVRAPASVDRITDPFASTMNLTMPPPQEPYDATPITPVETVGAAAYEPF